MFTRNVGQQKAACKLGVEFKQYVASFFALVFGYRTVEVLYIEIDYAE